MQWLFCQPYFLRDREIKLFDLEWNRTARILLLAAPQLRAFLHPTSFMLKWGIYLYLLMFFSRVKLHIDFPLLVRSTWSQVAQ